MNIGWLYEQSELIASIHLLFTWMPENIADLCTMAVVVTFTVALLRLICGVKNVFFEWL